MFAVSEIQPAAPGNWGSFGLADVGRSGCGGVLEHLALGVRWGALDCYFNRSNTVRWRWRVATTDRPVPAHRIHFLTPPRYRTWAAARIRLTSSRPWLPAPVPTQPGLDPASAGGSDEHRVPLV